VAASSVLIFAAEETGQLQREQLFQRFKAEIIARSGTNIISFEGPAGGKNLDIIRLIFDAMIVHPAFGYRWDEVPPPTLTGSNSMLAVSAFIATNGWHMHTGGLAFTYGGISLKPMRGLPWREIHEREFSAVTHNEIFYVVFSGWHHDCQGVAYNPNTNIFPPAITGFKPLASNWYVWAQAEFPARLEQRYEGQTTNVPGTAEKD